MKKLRLCLMVFATFNLAISIARAQASRTWVSGVGDDANPCSRTAPCKTFAGAISKTAPSGEIDALDPGGYGAVTITKAITIDGGGGQVASALVNGTSGIVVAAGSNDTVILRNLSINGIATALNGGINGIRFLSGKALHIEHCTISRFTNNGIDIALGSGGGSVFVLDTISQANGGAGLSAIASATYAQVTIDNSRFDQNANGVSALDYTRFSIRNSQAAGNSGVGFLAQANAGMAVVSIANSTSGNNNIGIQAGGGSAASSVRVAGVSLFLNASGFVIGSNGTISSFGNNYNSGSGAPNANIAPQ
jgi:hypothetical protein